MILLYQLPWNWSGKWERVILLKKEKETLISSFSKGVHLLIFKHNKSSPKHFYVLRFSNPIIEPIQQSSYLQYLSLTLSNFKNLIKPWCLSEVQNLSSRTLMTALKNPIIVLQTETPNPLVGCQVILFQQNNSILNFYPKFLQIYGRCVWNGLYNCM